MIDPIIRKQLAAQYMEWNNARSRLKGELKCNRCKAYFPREIITFIRVGNHNQHRAYCPECVKNRKTRGIR